MKRYILLSITFCLLAVGQSFSQVSTEGTDFCLSFGFNGGHMYSKDNVRASTLKLEIRIVTSEATHVTLTYTKSNAVREYDIPAGTIYVITLTPDEKEWASPSFSQPTSGISTNSVLIHSTKSVSVYALNQYNSITDATNVLPISALGTKYYQLSYASNLAWFENNRKYYNKGYYDGFTIVASEDNTSITIGNNSPINLPKAGGVYTYYTNDARTDLTGTRISASKPVAFFVTNTQLFIPDENNGAGDLIFQQLMNVDMWGSKFLVPVTARGLERIRILASQKTTVTQVGGTLKTDNNGSGSMTIGAGQFIELEINSSSKGCYITSTNPVAVCSYMVGNVYATKNNAPIVGGDPSMTWIPPLEQTIKQTVIAPFYMGGASILRVHYVTIVTPTATKDKTTMAVGTEVPHPLTGGTWIDNNGSDYSYYSLLLDDSKVGNTSFSFANPQGIIVLGYGLQDSESYYYLAGSATRDLVPSFYVNSYHFQDLEGMTICEAPYNIRGVVDGDAMSTAAGHLIWTLDGNEQKDAQDKLTWTIPTLTDGTHTITMTVKDISGTSKKIQSTFEVHCSEEVGNIVPAEQDVCIGKAEIMAPDNELTGTKTYQWQVSPNGFIWSDIAGANQKTYTITNQKRGITYYRLKMSDGNKMASTKSARVRIRSCSLPVNHNISVMGY